MGNVVIDVISLAHPKYFLPLCHVQFKTNISENHSDY